MAVKTAAKPLLSLDGVVFFVIGVCVWGKGRTQKEAWQKAGRPRVFQAFLAHADTHLDPMGYVYYPEGCVPREVYRRGLKPKDEGVSFRDSNEEER